MRTAKKLSKEQQESLECLLGKVKTKADFQRVQCLWLRSVLNLSSTNVALAVGLSRNTVKTVQSRYLRNGEKALLGQGRGGKRYSNLTFEEEDYLLNLFLEKASVGGILVVSEIKALYEEKAGKKVPKSTIYRMLARHGWRKIVPRSKHPKADHAIQDEFKKNSHPLSKKK